MRSCGATAPGAARRGWAAGRSSSAALGTALAEQAICGCCCPLGCSTRLAPIRSNCPEWLSVEMDDRRGWTMVRAQQERSSALMNGLPPLPRPLFACSATSSRTSTIYTHHGVCSELLRGEADATTRAAIPATCRARATAHQSPLPRPSLLQAVRPAAFTSQQQRRRSSRRTQRCLASAEEEPKGLDFSSNKRAVGARGWGNWRAVNGQRRGGPDQASGGTPPAPVLL